MTEKTFAESDLVKAGVVEPVCKLYKCQRTTQDVLCRTKTYLLSKPRRVLNGTAALSLIHASAAVAAAAAAAAAAARRRREVYHDGGVMAVR